MKKNITILVAALAVLLFSAGISSCSKNSSVSLSGTTWVASEEIQNQNYTVAYTLIFLSDTAYSLTMNYSYNGDDGADTFNGIYSVNGNSVTLILSVQTTTGTMSQNMTGTISGNTMTLSAVGGTMLFKKL